MNIASAKLRVVHFLAFSLRSDNSHTTPPKIPVPPDEGGSATEFGSPLQTTTTSCLLAHSTAMCDATAAMPPPKTPQFFGGPQKRVHVPHFQGKERRK